MEYSESKENYNNVNNNFFKYSIVQMTVKIIYKRVHKN